MLEIFWCLVLVVILVGIVYFVGSIIEEVISDSIRKIREGDKTEVFQARRFSDNFVMKPNNYYMKIVTLTGEVTAVKTDSGGTQQIELDGSVLCEFSEPQKGIIPRTNIKISGVCLGRIITGCKIEAS